jgi:hypothetical protein
LVYAKACTDDNSYEEEQQHYFRYLPLAQERLKQFPLLNEAFENFQIYDEKYDDKNQNYILNMAMPHKQFVPIPNDVKYVVVDDYADRYQSKLANIETSLNIFRQSMDEREYDEFTTHRLTHRNHFDSFNAVTEILTAYHIGKQIGYSNVDFQYKILATDKKPDLLITLANHKQMFLELTSLTIGTAEQKIKEILHDLAAYVLEKSRSKNFLVNIHLELNHLVKAGSGRIDETGSKLHLRSWSDRLYLHELIGCCGRIQFERHSTIDNEEYVIDLTKPRLNSYIPLGNNKELCDMITNQKLVNEWARKVKIDDFSKSIFLSASYRNYNPVSSDGRRGSCVVISTPEVDSDDPGLFFDPIMETSRLVKQAILDRVDSTIWLKYRKQQFEEGKPIVIGIEVNEWRLNFEEEYKEFLELKEVIQNDLKRYTDISGVIIFSSDLYNGRYIENKIANSAIEITESELQSSGIIKIYRTTES